MGNNTSSSDSNFIKYSEFNTNCNWNDDGKEHTHKTKAESEESLDEPGYKNKYVAGHKLSSNRTTYLNDHDAENIFKDYSESEKCNASECKGVNHRENKQCSDGNNNMENNESLHGYDKCLNNVEKVEGDNPNTSEFLDEYQHTDTGSDVIDITQKLNRTLNLTIQTKHYLGQVKDGFVQKGETKSELLKILLKEINNQMSYDFTSNYVEPYDVIEVPSSSEEYQNIDRVFRSSNRLLKIMKIEKVVNTFLLIQYELKKHEYKKKYGTVIEKLLFHGTKKCNVPLICENNFDWRLNGKARGHKFGQGVCFTPYVLYANCFGNRGLVRVMILTKVLVSSHCVGDKNMVIPPGTFDTTTRSKLQVYVKYEDNTFYPMYIIHYKDCRVLKKF